MSASLGQAFLADRSPGARDSCDRDAHLASSYRCGDGGSVVCSWSPTQQVPQLGATPICHSDPASGLLGPLRAGHPGSARLFRQARAPRAVVVVSRLLRASLQRGEGPSLGTRTVTLQLPTSREGESVCGAFPAI